MTWLTLSHAKNEGRSVQLRFRPDAFLHDQEAPVVEVTIEGVDEPEAAISALTRFHEDFVVDLVVDERELRVLGEMDDEETVVRGSRACSRKVPYSADELRQTAVSFERLLRDETSHAYRQAAKLRDIRHFVADLVERAEKKGVLSERSHDTTEAQLSVLRRILNRIDDA